MHIFYLNIWNWICFWKNYFLKTYTLWFNLFKFIFRKVEFIRTCILLWKFI